MKSRKITYPFLLTFLALSLSGCYTQFSNLDRADEFGDNSNYYETPQTVRSGDYYAWDGYTSANEGYNYDNEPKAEKPYLYQDEYFTDPDLAKEAELQQNGITYKDMETENWYKDNDLKNIYWEGYDDGFVEGFDSARDSLSSLNESAMYHSEKPSDHVYTTADFYGNNEDWYLNNWETRWSFQYRYNYALAHSYYARFGNFDLFAGSPFFWNRYRNPSFLSPFATFGNSCVGRVGFFGGFNNIYSNPCFLRGGFNDPFNPIFFNPYDPFFYDFYVNNAFGIRPVYGFNSVGFFGFYNNGLAYNNYRLSQRYDRYAQLNRLYPRNSGLTRTRSGLRSSEYGKRGGLARYAQQPGERRRTSGVRSNSRLERRSTINSRSSSSSRSRGGSSSGIRRNTGSSSGSSGIGRSRSGSSSSGSSGVGRSRSGGSSSSGSRSGSSGSRSGKRGGGENLSSSVSNSGNFRAPSTESRSQRSRLLLNRMRQNNSARTVSSSNRSVRTGNTSALNNSTNSRRLFNRSQTGQRNSSVARSTGSLRTRTAPSRSTRSTVRTPSTNRNTSSSLKNNTSRRSSGVGRSSSPRRSSSSVSRSSSSRRSSSSVSRSSSSRSRSSGSRSSGRSSSSKRGRN